MREGRLVYLAGIVSLLGCTRRDSSPEPLPTPAPSAASPAAATPRPSDEPAELGERRQEREEFIRRTVEERGVDDPAVLRAMRRVPRHHFVPEGVRDLAYSDRALPIVGDQTISQPYIVAAMTEAGEPTRSSRCLEVGTGSGYQAAVLAEVCGAVYSIEYLPEVAEFGKKNLERLGYAPGRVHLRVGDGYRGWPEAAPFDVILVTAAPEKVPEPLLEQLAMGGHLVIPLGPENGNQVLERWTRKGAGVGPEAFDRERLMDVRFVPFLGEAAE